MKIGVKDYLHLHFIVLVWGFTAVLGKLITLPPVELVFMRTLLAAIGLAIYMRYKKISFRTSKKNVILLLLTGALLGFHWITFFASARISNISISLVGIATCSFWTSLIEPIVLKRKLNWVELILGILVVGGLFVVYHADFSYSSGLLVAITSAILASIFSVFNSQFARKIDFHTIAFFEFSGSTLLIALFFPVYLKFFTESDSLQLIPTTMDWVYLAILSFLCTDYAFTASILLMKRISAYAINLTVNLEPVYGIILAFLVFGDSERMQAGFYIGAAMIIISVFIYPVSNYYKNLRAVRSKGL